jgi:hypothetical protein
MCRFSCCWARRVTQQRLMRGPLGGRASSKITDKKLFGDVFLYEPPFTRLVSDIELGEFK